MVFIMKRGIRGGKLRIPHRLNVLADGMRQWGKNQHGKKDKTRYHYTLGGAVIPTEGHVYERGRSTLTTSSTAASWGRKDRGRKRKKPCIRVASPISMGTYDVCFNECQNTEGTPKRGREVSYQVAPRKTPSLAKFSSTLWVKGKRVRGGEECVVSQASWFSSFSQRRNFVATKSMGEVSEGDGQV